MVMAGQACIAPIVLMIAQCKIYAYISQNGLLVRRKTILLHVFLVVPVPIVYFLVVMVHYKQAMDDVMLSAVVMLSQIIVAYLVYNLAQPILKKNDLTLSDREVSFLLFLKNYQGVRDIFKKNDYAIEEDSENTYVLICGISESNVVAQRQNIKSAGRPFMKLIERTVS